MSKQKFERELLEQVAEEMNEVMGLVPQMDFAMLEDGTLLDTITMEAAGRGVIQDAIRADDFVSDDADKKVFTKSVQKFFVAAGLWDAKAEAIIMPAEYDKKAAPSKPNKEETAAQAQLEEGETAPMKPAKAAKAKEKPAPKPGKKTGRTAVPAKEEEEVMPKKAAVKKGAAAKKGAAKTARGTATQKKAATKDKEQKGPSNKLLVFQAWKHGKGETDPEKLIKVVKGAVAIGTVRGWINAWGRGTNLPGGVTK